MKIVTRFKGAMLLGALALFTMHAGAAEAGGMCQSTAVTTAAGVAVEVQHNCFEPTVLEVRAGDSVTWTNRDAASHTVTGANQAWGNVDEFGRDEVVSFTFAKAGVYPYVCVLHPMMLGAVSVTEGDGAVPVSDLVATVIDAAEAEAVPEQAAIEPDRSDGVPLALAAGGVVVALVAGVGANAGWRRWRATRL